MPKLPPCNAWLACCAGIGVASAAATALILASVSPSNSPPPFWLQSPWAWGAASLVHLSWMHLAANLLGLGAVAVLGWALQVNRSTTAALLLAWPLTPLALQMWPDLPTCYGLSGLLHAATALLAATTVIDLVAKGSSNQVPKWFALTLSGGVVLKLALEQAWSNPVVWDAEFGFPVVQASHLVGALVGVGCGLGSAGGSRGCTNRSEIG